MSIDTTDRPVMELCAFMQRLCPSRWEYTCSVCNGGNVQMALWVDPNTDNVDDFFGTPNSGDNSYCQDCAEHHPVRFGMGV
jgi:hypothetical protein